MGRLLKEFVGDSIYTFAFLLHSSYLSIQSMGEVLNMLAIHMRAAEVAFGG